MASIQDIKNAKKKFLHELRKWKSRKSNLESGFQMRAVVHCTGEEMHFDFVAYSNRNIVSDRLRCDLRGIWKMAGGKSMTILDLEKERLGGQARYLYKAVNAEKFKRKRIYLLNTSQIQMTWNTRNFFQSKTSKDLWREVRVSWFGEESVREFELRSQQAKAKSVERTRSVDAIIHDDFNKNDELQRDRKKSDFEERTAILSLLTTIEPTTWLIFSERSSMQKGYYGSLQAIRLHLSRGPPKSLHVFGREKNSMCLPHKYDMQRISFAEFVLNRMASDGRKRVQQSGKTGPVGTSESPKKFWDRTMKLAWLTGERLQQQDKKL